MRCYLQMKTAVPTGTAALQSFDCTKYSRFGFTAKGQDCANVWAILCQFNPYSFHDAVHNMLNRITGIIKRNVFCIIKVALIFFPKAS